MNNVGKDRMMINGFIYFFDVLLTVHLIIFISVINQLDAQNMFHEIKLIVKQNLCIEFVKY